jgi:hypothetical protein
MSATSLAKIEANRRNAGKSTGPRNTGAVRHNSVKHGLRAEGLTALDDPGAYRESFDRLTAERQPEGELEIFLVETIALCMLRLRRARRIEADYLTEQLSAAAAIDNSLPQLMEEGEREVEPGRPALLRAHMIEDLAGSYQRYEVGFENRLYRAMNQLERLQRMRKGERVPAPAAIDVSLHTRGPR